MDRKTRKLLTIHGILHPRADVDRLYVKRVDGGRGLKHIETSFKNATYRIGLYLQTRNEIDYVVKAIREHEEGKSQKTSIIYKANRIASRVPYDSDEQQHPTVQTIKNYHQNCLKDAWLEKRMHGSLFRDMYQIPIDKETSYAWLKYTDLKGETESLLCAAQEQALKTRYIEHKIFKTRLDDKCRLCKNHIETVNHIMDSCPILAQKEYLDRHNKVCNAIHFEICKFFGCDIKTDKWYEHIPQKVTINTEGSVTMLYDQQIITDREVGANKPDLIIRTQKECYIIDVSIPSDKNIITKEAEKVLKYKSLLIEIQRMWNVKTIIVPIIIGATGFVSKDFKGYLSKIPGKHNPNQLQKIAILGTAHILRKVLQ